MPHRALYSVPHSPLRSAAVLWTTPNLQAYKLVLCSHLLGAGPRARDRARLLHSPRDPENQQPSPRRDRRSSPSVARCRESRPTFFKRPWPPFVPHLYNSAVPAEIQRRPLCSASPCLCAAAVRPSRSASATASCCRSAAAGLESSPAASPSLYPAPRTGISRRTSTEPPRRRGSAAALLPRRIRPP